MFFKRQLLAFGLLFGLGLPTFAVEPNPELNTIDQAKQDLINNNAFFSKIDSTFGPNKRSDARTTAEQLILTLLHNGVEVKDGTLAITPKKGITAVRDGLFKKGAYGILDTAVFEGLEKTGVTKDAYKAYIKPWVGDGFDFAFRGIKYLNDESKEQSITAYLKTDFGPYIMKKKVVWLAQLAIRKALERNENGRIILAAYDIAQLIPFLGIELEELPRTVLEFVYDKGIAGGRKIVQNYFLPKLKLFHISPQAA
jgi:hypothetical protein